MEKETIETKKIIYKGKEKIIPIKNPDSSKCEYYLIHKFRYCHFNKFNNSEFCIYHIPSNESKEEFCICPYDSKHRILKSKFKQHLKTCNTLAYKNEEKNNPWYLENFNKPQINFLDYNITNEELNKLYQSKYEDLEIEEYESYINKIINVYEICKNLYEDYVNKNNLIDYINKNFNKQELKDKNIFYKISGLNIDIENDLNHTEQLNHSLKHEIQKIAISSLILNSNLITINTKNCISIEFGAGKGGLSEQINNITNQNSINILLEREGLRYKLDKISKHMIRYRTDIINFNMNYLDDINKLNIDEETKSILLKDYYFIGIAKHICGCAFDLSLTCLFNYKNFDKIKGICMATCCHHICKVELLNNLDFYYNTLKMNYKEIIYLFKATSWIFGKITNKEKKNKKEKEKLHEEFFIKNKINKKYIGLIAKYIVDISRCMCLINKGFKVFYMKYCENKYTTENNLILAIK